MFHALAATTTKTMLAAATMNRTAIADTLVTSSWQLSRQQKKRLNGTVKAPLQHYIIMVCSLVLALKQNRWVPIYTCVHTCIHMHTHMYTCTLNLPTSQAWRLSAKEIKSKMIEGSNKLAKTLSAVHIVYIFSCRVEDVSKVIAIAMHNSQKNNCMN